MKRVFAFFALATALAMGQGSGIVNPPQQRDIERAGGVLSNNGTATNLTIAGTAVLPDRTRSQSAILGESNTGFAFGEGSTASGTSSAAIGLYATASSYSDIALGVSATASGGASFACGDGARAEGSGCVALGAGARATGLNTMAVGEGAYTSGSGGFAFGFGASASGGISGAFGDTAVASGDSAFAFGFRASAIHDGSVVFTDMQGTQFYSATNDSFNVRAQNGVFLTTPAIHINNGGGYKTGITTNLVYEGTNVLNIVGGLIVGINQ